MLRDGSRKAIQKVSEKHTVIATALMGFKNLKRISSYHDIVSLVYDNNKKIFFPFKLKMPITKNAVMKSFGNVMIKRKHGP